MKHRQARTSSTHEVALWSPPQQFALLLVKRTSPSQMNPPPSPLASEDNMATHAPAPSQTQPSTRGAVLIERVETLMHTTGRTASPRMRSGTWTWTHQLGRPNPAQKTIVTMVMVVHSPHAGGRSRLSEVISGNIAHVAPVLTHTIVALIYAFVCTRQK